MSGTSRAESTSVAGAALAQAPSEGSEALPLSFAQQRLWVLDRLLGRGAVYNVSRALRLRGALDVGTLERALGELIRRHEGLRTRFAAHEGEPVQVIEPAASITLELEDLSALAPEAREAEARRRARAEAQAPFDLEHGPLIRARLLRLSNTEHWLLVTLHHIVTDGWSMGVLARELSALYGAYREGKASPLAELAVQYADYALWQRDWLQGEALEAQLGYWKKALEALPVLELPTDRPRPAAASYRGGSVRFELDEALTGALKALSRRESATLFMTLLAAFQVLLYRYSGQEDFALGVPVAGRSRPELEPLIGFFVNTLVLRADLSGAPSFRELLSRVRTRSLEAYAHQDAPFEKLVEALAPRRELARNPLFQVAFVLQNAPSAELRLEALELELLEGLGSQSAKFDLDLELTEQAGRLRGTLSYATELFEPATIERLAGHYRVLLEAIASNPGQRIAELALLTERERHQLLVEWNDTATEYPREACIHELFEAQVERSPEAIALVYGEEQLSYRELNARANRLAHHLRALGVGPEVLVALCLERSSELIVALLAILKAGGAYVPLDPGYPAERLAFMLEDTQAPVLITEQPLLSRLPAYAGRTVCLALDASSIARQPETNPHSGSGPASLAYVLYTSGSTGKPKGVMIEQRSVVNYLCWIGNAFPLNPGDRVLQRSPFSFDVSVEEIFSPLTSGACLTVAGSGIEWSAGLLIQTVREGAITILQVVPSLLASLLEHPDFRQCSSLRLLLCGAEPLPAELVARFREQSKAELVNLYGPTETTIYSTFWSARERGPVRIVPIGRPIANTKAVVTDSAGELLPIGVPGELCIGGAGVARGYLHRADLTAERFIADPFSSNVKDRLYRTGDLVRYLSDGKLEFLGRIDRQLKIRGFRVEPGEIEEALRKHPAVADTAVVAREVASDSVQLVAYFIPSGRERCDANDLREYLRARLPRYMVPAVLIGLESFPRLPNGKLDRSRLPSPTRESVLADDKFVAPRNALEEQLAALWSEVLRLERIGVHEDFFELGGHSLLVMQLLSRILAVFGVRISPAEFFGGPTIAATAGHIQDRLGDKTGARLPAIRERERAGPAALSFAQQRLWVLERLLPRVGVYNVSRALRLRGVLDREALGKAFEELVRRHEGLRTRFAAHEGEPVQVIEPAASIALELEDLSALAPEAREAEARRRAKAEAQAPFDLEHGPLIRARLLRLSNTEHWLLVTLHHIVTDGWSMGVLARELSALYGAYRQGKASPLAELALQYADYALWQRDWLQGEALEAQLGYWKKALEALPVLELPTDRPRPAAASYRGARFEFELDEALTGALKALSRRESATLFMTLLAAFQVLLYRYSGQEDFALGVPVAGRSRPELEPLIGFFVNTLVLRADLSGAPSFRELLSRVRTRSLEAYAHQDAPFERLVEALAPRRELARNPLFQVAFVLQNAPSSALQLQDLELEPLEGLGSQSAKFDLDLELTEQAGRLRGTLSYATELFEPATIERLAGHYRVLLEAIASNPGQRIAELALLTERERHQLLVEWNDTATEYPREACIHELFEAQVERSPEAIALVYEEEQLSYRELNCRANRLAHHLRSLGVGPEVMVGLCLERSVELVVALLAILKAGGAYVPLDPDYPQERLAFMLEDTAAPVLLTQGGLRERLPAAYRGGVVALDEDSPEIARQSERNPRVPMSSRSLAYVIYTSGSTGRPKGVCIEHRSVVRLVKDTRYVEFGPQEVFLQFAPISFDASTFELWGSLLNGARLVVCPADRLSLEELGAVIQKSGVTTLWLTAALFNQMVDTQLESLRSVRQLLAGGEALSPPHVRRMLEVLGDARLINGYGPTENTTFTCCYVMNAHASIGPNVPIGRPISNTRVYILDGHRRPVPLGACGELYIGGDGLAREYLHQPQLTAEKFLPDPFSGDPQARLYRSGDRVRYLPDGNIEFLDRIDDQLKIRGFRIEPGEIEAVLAEHPAVRQAAVLARELRPGERTLIAYLVVRGDQRFNLEAMRRHLGSRLPHYMVPAHFVALPSLPLGPNGKVDRAKLPEPGREDVISEEPFVAPRDALEEQLAALWSEVLRLERIGVHEDFFELGGHSLLAMQLLARVGAVFGVRTEPAAFFALPTIAAMAGHIHDLFGRKDVSGLPAIRERERAGPAALSFAQQRLWVLERLLPRVGVYNVSRALRLRGVLDREALGKAFEELVRRHEGLRTRFAAHEGEPVQVIEPAASIALELEDLSALAPEAREAEARRRAKAEAQAPFDLEHGPLIRARLLRLSNTEHWLLVTLHHIVTDGWSMGVLARELSALYGAYRQGKASPLAELALQYADYALWQRDWLQGEALEAQLGYWKKALEALPVLELPTDRPRPAAASYRGARFEFELDEALTGALKALSRRESATLFMTLLAAFQVLLYRYSGQEDFALGVPVAGRSRPELEPLIGFFVNTLVLRADLSGAPSFRELLSRVRTRSLEAYAHQDAPFERLVEALAPRRELARNPLFQVAFVLQNAPSSALQLQDLELEPLEGLGSQSAKFDLDLELTEQAGRLRGTLSYATELFEPATIERLAGHYRVLLEAIASNPGQRIAELALLTERERHQLLVEWNDTATEYPREACIHELFEAQVERSPEAIALVYEEEQLSYRELNCRANRLAHHLRSLGVGPEVMVGLCLERSVELVVALLAILKAGGAYVPLDPDYPQERLAFMLEDTAAPVLLTQGGLRERLPAAYRGGVVALDEDSPEIARQSERNPRVPMSSRSLAYVIYTSGSTGKPKAVMVEQRSILRLVCNADYVRLGSDDVVAQASNACFDAMTFEIWGALVNGARITVLRKSAVIDPQALARAIGAQGITTLFLTTALFNQLAHASPSPFSGLKHLLFGGETADPATVRRVLERGTPRRLIHVYGPTETTTFATWYEVRHLGPLAGHVPIGGPIADTCVYVVDSALQPVPPGVAGELLIGGEGVARGYLRRPELTAERFIPNPFSASGTDRLYRSGDLVRWRPDRTLEFIGRRDAQVKIRGFRVEPAEVEALLASHPALAGCAVLAREIRPGERALVAYLAPREGGAVDADTVRRFLASKLPEYMLPARFVIVRALPLTPNGKIDRDRLPSPLELPTSGGLATQAPQDQLELHLVKLWERLLGLHGVGIGENFFELGGHSLLAARLFDEIERHFGRRLPLDTLWYQGATIADLAHLLRADVGKIAWPILVPIKPAGTKPALFVVHTMGGNLFHYDELARALDPEQPVFGLQARGVYGRERPRQRIEDIASDCVSAMRRHQPGGPYRVAGFSSAGVLAFEVARQLEATGARVALLALIDSFSPRARMKRPFLRAAAKAFGRPQFRLVQERLYHALLHRSGLTRWRRLNRIGEAQRWAHWSYRAPCYGGAASLFVTAASLDLVREPTLGWHGLVRGGLRIHHLPGGHSSIMKGPLVSDLAGDLQAELDCAAEEAPVGLAEAFAT